MNTNKSDFHNNSFPSHRKSAKQEKAGLATFFGIGTYEINKSIEALDRMLDQYDSDKNLSHEPKQKMKLIDPAAKMLATCIQSSSCEQRFRTNSLINGIPDTDLPPPPPEMLGSTQSYNSLPETSLSKIKLPPSKPKRDPETKLSFSSIESSLNTSQSSREDVSFELSCQRIPESGYITPDQETIDSIFTQNKIITKFPGSYQEYSDISKPVLDAKYSEFIKPPEEFDDTIYNKQSSIIFSNGKSNHMSCDLDQVVSKISNDVIEHNINRKINSYQNLKDKDISKRSSGTNNISYKPDNKIPNLLEKIPPPIFPKSSKQFENSVDYSEPEIHNLPFKVNLKPVSKKACLNDHMVNLSIDENNKKINYTDKEMDFPPPPFPIQLSSNFEYSSLNKIPPPVSAKSFKKNEQTDLSLKNKENPKHDFSLKNEENPKFDISLIPGYQVIPENCPVWKRALIEKKNKQIYDEALKEYLAQKQEEEKWKNIPDWKRQLIIEKEKKKT